MLGVCPGTLCGCGWRPRDTSSLVFYQSQNSLFHIMLTHTRLFYGSEDRETLVDGRLRKRNTIVLQYKIDPPCVGVGVGVGRNDDEVSFTQREKEAAVETRQNGSGGGGSSLVAGAGDEAMDITYSRRSRPGQAAEVVRLGDITHDLESRYVWCEFSQCTLFV